VNITSYSVSYTLGDNTFGKKSLCGVYQNHHKLGKWKGDALSTLSDAQNLHALHGIEYENRYLQTVQDFQSDYPMGYHSCDVRFRLAGDNDLGVFQLPIDVLEHIHERLSVDDRRRAPSSTLYRPLNYSAGIARPSIESSSSRFFRLPEERFLSILKVDYGTALNRLIEFGTELHNMVFRKLRIYHWAWVSRFSSWMEYYIFRYIRARIIFDKG
jgi:hypothetical protein